jgi:omega-6 fatty acid desaturase (delta-12 desaturase)
MKTVYHSDQSPGSGIRNALPGQVLRRSTAKGVGLFVLLLTSYVLSFMLVAADSVILRIAGSAGVFVFSVMLFVIGHDACHGGLTERQDLNRIIGRLSFLPSYHPFTSWEHTHNGLHHGYTNIRGHDPVFAPHSKGDYDSFPPVRRALERFYRMTPGLGLYYFVEIWWKLELLPAERFRPAKARLRSFMFDRAAVAGFFLLQIILLASLARTFTEGIEFVVLGTALPFIAFNYSIGFAIFLHHTHPKVAWHKDTSHYNFVSLQTRSSVHVEFPHALELMMLYIMSHTAHHIHARIPLYNLRNAQTLVEAAHPDVIREPWTLRSWRTTLRTCRLYDYDNHRWMDYDGTPLTATLPQPESRASS